MSISGCDGRGGGKYARRGEGYRNEERHEEDKEGGGRERGIE